MLIDDEALVLQIAFGLERLGAVARQKQWEQAESSGLTPTQIAILELAASRSDGVRITDAAAQIGVTQPTASDAARSLVDKGLLERRADPDDRRATRLHPTSEGGQLLDRLGSGHEAVARAVSPRDRPAFFAALVRAVATLQRGGDIPLQRMCLSCKSFEPDRHDNPDKPHHCRFLNAAIGPAGLMLDCPDHQFTDYRADRAASMPTA